MTVIGFDPVIAIRARPLPTMLPHAALDLQFSNRRRITSQPVSGKHLWRWIVRIGHRSSQEQLGGFAIARLRQVEIHGLALAVHRPEQVHLCRRFERTSRPCATSRISASLHRQAAAALLDRSAEPNARWWYGRGQALPLP